MHEEIFGVLFLLNIKNDLMWSYVGADLREVFNCALLPKVMYWATRKIETPVHSNAI